MNEDFGFKYAEGTKHARAQKEVWEIFRKAIDVNVDDQYTDADECVKYLVHAQDTCLKLGAKNVAGTIHFYLSDNIRRTAFPVCGNEMVGPEYLSDSRRLNTNAKESSHCFENRTMRNLSLKEIVLKKRGTDFLQNKVLQEFIENSASKKHVGTKRSYQGLHDHYNDKCSARKRIRQQHAESRRPAVAVVSPKISAKNVGGFASKRRRDPEAWNGGYGKPANKSVRAKDHLVEIQGARKQGADAALNAFKVADANFSQQKCEQCKRQHRTVYHCRITSRHDAAEWSSPAKQSTPRRSKSPARRSKSPARRSKSPTSMSLAKRLAKQSSLGSPSSLTQRKSPRKQGSPACDAMETVDLQDAMDMNETIEVFFPDPHGWCFGQVMEVSSKKVVLKFAADNSEVELKANSTSSIRTETGVVKFCDFVKKRLEPVRLAQPSQNSEPMTADSMKQVADDDSDDSDDSEYDVTDDENSV